MRGIQITYDARVKEKYMNELRLVLNKSDFEDMTVKKYLKEFIITIYTNKMYLLCYGSIIEIPICLF